MKFEGVAAVDEGVDAGVGHREGEHEHLEERVLALGGFPMCHPPHRHHAVRRPADDKSDNDEQGHLEGIPARPLHHGHSDFRLWEVDFILPRSWNERDIFSNFF